MNQHMEYLQELNTTAKNFWFDWQTQYAQWRDLDQEEIVHQSNELLRQYFSHVVFEMEGLSDEQQRRIVISANGNLEGFPEVMALTDSVPEDLPHAVSAFRSPLGDPSNLHIGMGGFELNIKEILCKLEVYAEMPSLLVAFPKPIEPEFEHHAKNMAMILLDHLVGEFNSAVKIPFLDFVDEADSSFSPMVALPEQLETLWREELGRTGIYPQPEFQFASANIEEDEEAEQDALVLTRNQSANSLLGRADMAWLVSVDCQINDAQDLEAAYALEDAFTAYAQQNQQGIQTLAQMNMSRGVRTVFAMTSMPQVLLQQALNLCEEFSQIQASAACEHDPSWQHYRL